MMSNWAGQSIPLGVAFVVVGIVDVFLEELPLVNPVGQGVLKKCISGVTIFS